MIDVTGQHGRVPGSQRALSAIILAAGKSTRMKSDLPKVAHEICGQPMLAYVLDACREAGIEKHYVVVGFGKEIIQAAFSHVPGIQFVEQREQKGTGHAVSMCAEVLRDFDGDVVVLAGDMPLVRSETLQSLIKNHRDAGAVASLATTVLDDPTGYGRIVRDFGGKFTAIVEDRDCTPEQRRINEVNPSYYCFDARSLFEALPQVKPNNAKGEHYITDVVEILRKAGKPVCAATSVVAADATGINSRADLATVSAMMQRRIGCAWMEQGVTIIDPASTWIDSRAKIGKDTVIRPFSYIEGHSRIGLGCKVGPYAYVEDGAVLNDGETAGPGILSALDGAHLRKATTLAAQDRRAASATRQPPSVRDQFTTEAERC